MVLLLVAGILLAEVFSPPPLVPLLLLSAALLLSLLFLLAKSSEVTAIVLQIGVVLLGFTLRADEQQNAESEKLIPLFENEPVVFTGFVDTEPEGGGRRVRCIVQTDGILRADGSLSSGRRVLVETKKTEWSDSLFTGVRVRIAGALGQFPGPRNPGEFDPRRYFGLKGVSGVVVVEENNAIAVLLEGSRTSMWSLMASARRAFARKIDERHGETVGAYLKGLILAERGNIPFEIKQSFVDTGTIHILAVSGLHVALVAVVFYSVFGLFRLPRWSVAVLTMLGLFGYMILTGATASVVRATIMACVILSGKLLERRADMYQALAISALIILLVDSTQLFDVGFQLSYAAVISIVWLYPFFEKLISRIPERFEEIRVLEQVLKLFAVSLAAQLGTLPFTAYYFERISIVSLAANLIAVPVSSLNLMVGFATIAASFVNEWAAGTFAAVNDLLVSFLLGFVGEAARVPFSTLNTAGVSGAFPFVYYAGLTGLFVQNRWGILKKLLFMTLAGSTLFLYLGLFQKEEIGLAVTVLDVGQGDAVLVRFPNGKCLLIDGGPKSLTYDAGERIVAPYLRRVGVDRIDALAISHPHSDHLGGVEFLTRSFKVGMVYEATEAGVSGMHRSLRNTIESEGILKRIVGAGEVIDLDPNARVYLMNPLPGHDSSDNLNNHSIVMKIIYGSTSLLLPGDAEEETEERMQRRFGGFLDSDILKVGHHGSVTSSSDEFLDSITPDIAIISVGTKNKFHHPSPEVVRKLMDRGVALYRTDRDGAIVLESNGHQFRRIQWRSP